MLDSPSTLFLSLTGMACTLRAKACRQRLNERDRLLPRRNENLNKELLFTFPNETQNFISFNVKFDCIVFKNNIVDYI
jgi:hypothetical protein